MMGILRSPFYDCIRECHTEISRGPYSVPHQERDKSLDLLEMILEPYLSLKAGIRSNSKISF